MALGTGSFHSQTACGDKVYSSRVAISIISIMSSKQPVLQVIRTRDIKWWILGERCIHLIMAFGDRVRAFADGSGDRVI